MQREKRTQAAHVETSRPAHERRPHNLHEPVEVALAIGYAKLVAPTKELVQNPIGVERPRRAHALLDNRAATHAIEIAGIVDEGLTSEWLNTDRNNQVLVPASLWDAQALPNLPAIQSPPDGRMRPGPLTQAERGPVLGDSSPETGDHVNVTTIHSSKERGKMARSEKVICVDKGEIAPASKVNPDIARRRPKARAPHKANTFVSLGAHRNSSNGIVRGSIIHHDDLERPTAHVLAHHRVEARSHKAIHVACRHDNREVNRRLESGRRLNAHVLRTWSNARNLVTCIWNHRGRTAQRHRAQTRVDRSGEHDTLNRVLGKLLEQHGRHLLARASRARLRASNARTAQTTRRQSPRSSARTSRRLSGLSPSDQGPKSPAPAA